MVRSLRPVARGSWLDLKGRTARLRLTLLYAGMFLLLGTALIAIIYLLTSTSSTVHSVRVAPVPAAPGPVLRVAPQAGAQHSSDLARLLAVSWLVLAITAIASALLGWLAAGRVLRPLREMTAAARMISAGNLSERLALRGPDDEFKQLGDTLDDLLARLEASFEAQRRFIANASHELRTPLTLERTLLQVALADPDASAATLRATCEELLASGREQERLLEALLTLALSEGGLERRQQLDLAKLAGDALDVVGPEIDGRSSRSPTPARSSPPTRSSGCWNRSNGSTAIAAPEPAAATDSAFRSSARSPSRTVPPCRCNPAPTADSRWRSVSSLPIAVDLVGRDGQERVVLPGILALNPPRGPGAVQRPAARARAPPNGEADEFPGGHGRRT